MHCKWYVKVIVQHCWEDNERKKSIQTRLFLSIFGLRLVEPAEVGSMGLLADGFITSCLAQICSHPPLLHSEWVAPAMSAGELWTANSLSFKSNYDLKQIFCMTLKKTLYVSGICKGVKFHKCWEEYEWPKKFLFLSPFQKSRSVVLNLDASLGHRNFKHTQRVQVLMLLCWSAVLLW